jgi:hypothetical protein
MKGQPKERLAVGLGAAILAISVLWFGFQSSSRNEAKGFPMPLGSAEYKSMAVDAVIGTESIKWSAPESMSRGKEWVYDVFTPPEVYYDAQSGKFRLTPPSREAAIMPVADSRKQIVPGLTLHAVDREPFPLQLIGFVGEPGNYLGTFANKVTRETLLLREGTMVDSLQMLVREFRVEQVEREIPESMTVTERQAVAVIVDQRTGEETRLRQGETALTSGRLAWVSLDENGEVMTVEEGALIDAGGDQFRIDKIRLAPPEVDVTKEKQSDGASESHTLRPLTPKFPDDDE